ncbi:MAG: polysulfide reductase NrfD, partial [Chloroflexi bacterium]|nr:polysulfide reductase NrfD [Chloroflexota bacterium]
RVFWSATTLLPALFTASALSMGAATILLVTRLLGMRPPQDVVNRLRQVDIMSLVFEAVVLAILMVTLALFSSPLASRAAQDILVAPLGLVFWFGVVVVGILIPLALEGLTSRIRPKPVASILVIGPVLILVGSLVLRYVVVFGGQTQGWISRPPL